MHDPISDFFVTLKNGYTAQKERVLIPFSQIRFEIAKVLERQGFVAEVDRKKKKLRSAQHPFLDIRLKYQDKEPAMKGLRLISIPSRRIYLKSKDIRSVRSGAGIAIFSTPKGIITGQEARKQNVGGQFIAEIW